MTQTRAIRVHEPGGPEVLTRDSIDLPKPEEDEIQVRHEAIGVNFIDTYHRNGLYPLDYPATIGKEGAGIVEAVGVNVTTFAPGDRVAYGAGPPGSYADVRNIPAHRVVELPDAIGFREAAAMMLKGTTVEYLVRRTFEVDETTTVLWHAAAGGVGRIACQWLDALGATVIGTVSTEAKAQKAREAGCDYTIQYTEEEVVERVEDLTESEGVDVVYDGVGRDTFRDSLDCLTRRGTMVAFGNASGAPEPIEPLELAERGSLYLTRPSLGDYVATREDLADSTDVLFEHVQTGDVEAEIGQTWPLEEAEEAHRALENRETTGSTVLLP